ncbi:hypothetical protein Lal_00039562 [Lupinus albus]|nr:hypothetical protein Lal_00039562 [Lupinus albus]
MVSHVLKINPTYPKQRHRRDVIDYQHGVIDYIVSDPKIAISRPGETTLAQARILQYSPGFHPPRLKFGVLHIWDVIVNDPYIPLYLVEGETKDKPKSVRIDDENRKAQHNLKAKNIITSTLSYNEFFRI